MTTQVVARKRLTAKQEAFSVYYFKFRDPDKAAILAGYSRKTAAVIASQNLNKVNIRKRLAELGAKVESDAVGTVSERKKRLTAMYRADFDIATITPAHILTAIAEQNKMERIGTTDDKPQYNDNRQYNIIIQGDDNKAKLQQLLSGEKPKTIEAVR